MAAPLSLRRTLFVALLAAAACGGEKKAREEACGQGPRAYDARAYALSARYDWDTGRLVATEQITLALCPDTGPAVTLDSAVDVSRVHAGDTDLAVTADPATETLTVQLGPLAGKTTPVTFTVEYETGGVTGTTSVANDPVRSRVAFTDSEPRAGHLWLVEKDDPSDPALFSVTLDVAAGEDVVANGERVLDEALPGGGRRVGYALSKPIATYLMAFAAGELEHTTRTYTSTVAGGKAIPLALWWRRGLPIDPTGNLDVVEHAMAAFERLLGPYPWDSYSTVLLPAPFGGGMENATITFNAESSGVGWVSDNLNAHELAHHWFGDHVTMRTYDDVWVKEGMATLLASEAQRAFRDRSGSGRLFGNDFGFDPKDAIVDPDLHGLDKYTSGPYGRAASLITQIRALVGEQAFWASCRAFLAAHAGGSATGEEFVRAFAPQLSASQLLQVLARLPARDVPSFDVHSVGDGFEVRVTDPGHALLAPYTLTTVTSPGSASTVTLVPGQLVPIALPAGTYLALDEPDVHPYWDLAWFFQGRLAPSSFDSASATAFLARSSAQQERALILAFTLPSMAPVQLSSFLAELDSSYARRYTLRLACQTHAGDSAEWLAALAAALAAPPVVRYDSSLVTRCPLAAGQAFEAELLALEADPAPAALARLEYLLSFRYGAQGSAAIQRLSTGAPTLELRQLAASRLALSPPGVRAAASASEALEGAGSEGKAARAPARGSSAAPRTDR